MNWNWTTPVGVSAGIGALEAIWLYAKYTISRPEDRARIISEAINYALAWIIAGTIYGIINNGLFYSISAWLDSIGGFQPPPYSGNPASYIANIGGIIKSVWTEVFAIWTSYWSLITFYKFFKSIGAGFNFYILGIQVSVSPSALADWVQNYAWSFSTGLQWLMADLAFLYGMWIIWNVLYITGAWIWGISLIVPRTTRPIGAGLTVLFLVLSIGMPALTGLVEWLAGQYTGFNLFSPCPLSVLLNNPNACAPSLQSIAGNLTKLIAPFQVGLNLPVYGYNLMAWDAVLDVIYLLMAGFTIWLSRLIDERAPVIFNP